MTLTIPQTADGWTHLRNLETTENAQVDGNLAVGGVISGPAFQNLITTSAFTSVSTTTLAAVAGLSASLVAGTYFVNGQLFVTAVNAGGLIAEFIGSGGLALSSANVEGINKNGATVNADTIVTALASDFSNYANTCTIVNFSGNLTVSTAGTIGISAAQHTSNAVTTTIGTGSTMSLTRTA